MSRRIRQHIRSNVVGYIALFLVVSGGTAQALNGSNTVFSDDIVNREVKNPDLALGAVTTNRLGPNAVKSGRVADRSLTRSDVADDTLTGDQILESSLGPVPDASHANSATSIAGDSVTTSKFGQITRRSNTVMIAGGAGENGSYVTGTQSVDCQPGEMAIDGDAFWAGQANEELFISELYYTYSSSRGPVGLNVTGGNDSGATRQLNIAVYCLAP